MVAVWINRMSALRSIYDTCRPRVDVQAGTTKDEQFAADLAQVVNKTAPKEYADPAVFFRHSHPTRGMKDLLKAALTRLSGRGEAGRPGGRLCELARHDPRRGAV